MKPFLIFGLVLVISFPCFSQKVSLRTYDNHVNIDNYWGEVDSLILKENIKRVKTYLQKDSLILIQTVEYIKGRKVYVEDRSDKYGDIERRIFYDYVNNKVDASIIHYPCEDGYKRLPSNKFYYLKSASGYKYTRDSSGIVFMLARHEWLPNGDIFFSSFNRRGKMIDSLMMHRLNPVASSYDKLKFPTILTIYSDSAKIILDEELAYDEKGRLIRHKMCEATPCIEDKYYYDSKGLLLKYERSVGDKLDRRLLYEYLKQ